MAKPALTPAEWESFLTAPRWGSDEDVLDQHDLAAYFFAASRKDPELRRKAAVMCLHGLFTREMAEAIRACAARATSWSDEWAANAAADLIESMCPPEGLLRTAPSLPEGSEPADSLDEQILSILDERGSLTPHSIARVLQSDLSADLPGLSEVYAALGALIERGDVDPDQRTPGAYQPNRRLRLHSIE